VNETDRWLTRLIAGTVCALAVVFAVTACWQVIEGYEADKNVHDLLYLIVGGLLGQVTTHAVQAVKDGMQNVQVPAPLIPDDSLKVDPIPTSDVTAGTNPVVEIHPDAPEASDL
jgi:hypothetical protein